MLLGFEKLGKTIFENKVHFTFNFKVYRIYILYLKVKIEDKMLSKFDHFCSSVFPLNQTDFYFAEKSLLNPSQGSNVM